MTTYKSMLICEEGEYIIPLCDDLLNEVGWNLGDEIDIEISYDADTGKKGLFCMKKGMTVVLPPGVYMKEIPVSQYVKKLQKGSDIRKYESTKRKARQKKGK